MVLFCARRDAFNYSTLMAENLDKEIDDIAAPIPEPKTNWLLVTATALGTTLIVIVLAALSGVIGVNTAPTTPPAPFLANTNGPTDLRIKGN